MGSEHSRLRARLEAFRIGPQDVSLSFRDRLARENGWSCAFADRVVEEYKRFVFLAVTAGHPVTPSDQVDQAWHLHLVYTESYWTELCGGILGQPLHHGPTRGGPAEGRKFRDWYGETLTSYERCFGAAPPRDVWPHPHERFADADRFRRINTANTILLRRPRLAWRQLAVAASSVVLGCVAIGGRGSMSVLESWLLAAAIVILFVWLFRAVMRSRKRDRKGDGCGGGAGCGALGCGTSGCGHGGCGGGGCGGCGS